MEASKGPEIFLEFLKCFIRYNPIEDKIKNNKLLCAQTHPSAVTLTYLKINIFADLQILFVLKV